MADSGELDPGPERDEGDPARGLDTDEQLRRALEQERHRAAARSFFEAAPFYRVEFEPDGTVSLREKNYDYWPNRPPAAATRWRLVSRHRDLDEAERRLRHITSPHIYYDEHGRLARAPEPGGHDLAVPRNPWRA